MAIGTTKLPEADVRRKLAHALGVRHVDILVEAGEHNELEVEPISDAYSPAVQRLQPLIDQVRWDPAKYQNIGSMLKIIADPERTTAWSRSASDVQQVTIPAPGGRANDEDGG
jgi:hypothetical protein